MDDVRGDKEARLSEDYWELVEWVDSQEHMPEETKEQIKHGAAELRDRGIPFL